MAMCSSGRPFCRVVAGLVAIVLLFGVLNLALPANAAINPQINFQGKLTNPDGTNVTNGTYSIVFSLYTVASGGSSVWSETQGSVSITDGIFQVALGSVSSLPGGVDFNSSPLYLGIKVGADAEMSPRIPFTAAPYAFNADTIDGINGTSLFQIGSAAAQVDASTNPALFLNKTGSGNLIQLQNTATNVFTVGNTGSVTLGQTAAQSINVAQTATNAAGQSLTVAAGQGGAGAAANAGGTLILQAGAGGGTNGNGGNVTIAAGALIGSGTVGSVIIKNPSDSTTAFQLQDAGGTQLFVMDTTNDRIYIGNVTSDSLGVLLVLDAKNTTGDPTGVNGGQYYNGNIAKNRCYEGGKWKNCTGRPADQERRTGNLQKVGITATTMTALGMPAPTINGTPSSNAQAESSYVNWASAATTNSIGGMTTAAFATTQIRYLPRLSTRIRLDATALTNVRYWVALNSAALTGSNGTGQYVGLRYSTNAVDTAWQCASSDGTTPSTVTTGIAPVVGDYYDIIVDASVAGTLTCAIATNGGNYTVVSKSTNLPAAATNLGYTIAGTTLANAARSISASYASVEQN